MFGKKTKKRSTWTLWNDIQRRSKRADDLGESHIHITAGEWQDLAREGYMPNLTIETALQALDNAVMLLNKTVVFKPPFDMELSIRARQAWMDRTGIVYVTPEEYLKMLSIPEFIVTYDKFCGLKDIDTFMGCLVRIKID